MCESIARSYDSNATPRISSRSCERVKIRPGLAARVRSRPNSVAVSSIGRAGHLGPHPRDVEDHVAGADQVARRRRGLGSPQHGPDARHELAWAERLGQVVVGTELEPEQLVELVVPCGQHHDRDRRVAPQLAGDVEPVETGQPRSSTTRSGCRWRTCAQRGRPVGGDEDLEPGVLEVVAGELGDLRLVVDDEDRLHRGHRSARAHASENGCAPGPTGPRAHEAAEGPPSSRLRCCIRRRRLLG